MTLTKREARRIRNREDFERATRQAVLSSPDTSKALSKLGIVDQIGVNAGLTIREHLEDEIKKMVRVYNKYNAEAANVESGDSGWGKEGVEVRRAKARAIIRGLCKALLIYEDSYHKDDPAKLKAIEKEFLNG